MTQRKILWYCRQCKELTTKYEIGHVCCKCGSKLIVKNFKWED